nr:uncharacterized protein LOC129278711 [Lytechinus pictus]
MPRLRQVRKDIRKKSPTPEKHSQSAHSKHKQPSLYSRTPSPEPRKDKPPPSRRAPTPDRDSYSSSRQHGSASKDSPYYSKRGRSPSMTRSNKSYSPGRRKRESQSPRRAEPPPMKNLPPPPIRSSSADYRDRERDANHQLRLPNQAAGIAGTVPPPANRGDQGRAAVTHMTDPTHVNLHRREEAVIVLAGSSQGEMTIGAEGVTEETVDDPAAVAGLEEGWTGEWTEVEIGVETGEGPIEEVIEAEEEVEEQAEGEEEKEGVEVDLEGSTMEIATLAMVDTMSKGVNIGIRRIHEGVEAAARGVQREVNGNPVEKSGIVKEAVLVPLLHLLGDDTISHHLHLGDRSHLMRNDLKTCVPDHQGNDTPCRPTLMTSLPKVPGMEPLEMAGTTKICHLLQDPALVSGTHVMNIERL